jgi:hypothetical protein
VLDVEQTAGSAPIGSARRPRGEFFADPAEPTQRRYEALRAYLLEGASAAAAATRFGYTETTLASLVRTFGPAGGSSSAPPNPDRRPRRPRSGPDLG